MNIEELSKEDQIIVKDILDGKKKLKIKTMVNGLSSDAKHYLQVVYSGRHTLSVSECAIWLSRNPATIYEYIYSGKVIAYRIAGERGNFTIDVEKTKKSLGM